MYSWLQKFTSPVPKLLEGDVKIIIPTMRAIMEIVSNTVSEVTTTTDKCLWITHDVYVCHIIMNKSTEVTTKQLTSACGLHMMCMYVVSS